jgi:rubrerythrin
MKKYICSACKYSTYKENKPRTCPYCGKPSMIEEEKVEELI